MNVLLFIMLLTVNSILVIIIYENYINRKRAREMKEICKAVRKLNEQYRRQK